MVHIRFEGRSYDVSPERLGVKIGTDDRSLLASLARFLDVAPKRLANYVIDRRPNGNVIVHPQAVYG